MIARAWLRGYLKRNRRTMSAVQIKAVATTARQIDVAWTLEDLAAALRATMHAPAQSEKPIYMVGATTAEYVLSILP